MHGTLLDQRVFESLVHRCLPIIHDHFSEVDVQLSVASLPWFLSLCVTHLINGTCAELWRSQVHQQHADGIRLPDNRLFLLHGSEGAIPDWVSNSQHPMRCMLI